MSGWSCWECKNRAICALRRSVREGFKGLEAAGYVQEAFENAISTERKVVEALAADCRLFEAVRDYGRVV